MTQKHDCNQSINQEWLYNLQGSMESDDVEFPKQGKNNSPFLQWSLRGNVWPLGDVSIQLV
jgi:hypothetical protein